VTFTNINTAPTFASNPINQLVANNANLTYQLPTATDAEGNAIAMKLTPTLTWVTLVGT
jgi:hypothetical protein